MVNHSNEPTRPSWSERWEMKSTRQRLKTSFWYLLVFAFVTAFWGNDLDGLITLVSDLCFWACLGLLIYLTVTHFRNQPTSAREQAAGLLQPLATVLSFWTSWARPAAATMNTAAATTAAGARPAAAPVPGQVMLGVDPARRPVRLSAQQLAAHGVILGATGSGKSTSLLSILCQQVGQGAPVIAIDLKGSLQFASALETAAKRAGRPFRVWRPEGPAHWNPLAYGDATELKDKLISAEKFTEPHYQRAAERYLQTTLQVLQAAAPDRPITLATVVGALEVDTLKKLLVHCPKELMARVGPYISQLNRDQQSAALGIQSRLAVISESAVGAWLQPGPEQIDLRHTLTGGNEVVLFSLNASRYGKLSAQIAAMVVQDIIAIAGHRLETRRRDLALVAVDEFSALEADNILNLLARAREAGISILLSTQEMADLERLATGFRDQVLGNSGFLLAHRQNVPDSAELIAKMIGTRTVWQHTYQTEASLLSRMLTGDPARKTGRGTRKAVEEFQIHPNTIKSLSTGQAVLLTKIPTSAATPLNITAWTGS